MKDTYRLSELSSYFTILVRVTDFGHIYWTGEIQEVPDEQYYYY